MQASTSEVYGDPQIHPQPATYVGHVNPIGPRSCYDECKRCAKTVKGLTGSCSELVQDPLPTDDPKQRQPDITLAQEQLGREPTVTLEDGLKPTIAYFERLLRA